MEKEGRLGRSDSRGLRDKLGESCLDTWSLVDKLKFQFKSEKNDEDDNEDDSTSDEESDNNGKVALGTWICSRKNCCAKLNVLDDSISVENQNEFLHTCNPCLKLEVFGELDGFKLHQHFKVICPRSN